MRNKILCSVLLFFLFLLPLYAGERHNIDKTAGLIGLIIFSLCVHIGWIAVAILYSIIYPGKVMAGSECVNRKWGGNLLTGVLILLGGLLLIVISQNFLGDEKNIIVIVPVILIILYFLISGSAMVFHNIGERIQMNINSSTVGSSFYALTFGGILILCINFLPLIGQLILLIIIFEALGASVRSLFSN